ncbi:MAG: dihydrodipicolinate synthase family protein [Candidatus Marinimicrobia bacterium]|jgi:4-hydroxy-tetrahydrodipicolinate synthase|nr:dihydrodipicolinate synthase family protein [Candidatus Neomarinimicrobiota bacterium]MDP7060338.1 dihydrodipicolinate synthase family protein [Candidatus Neomarinimicrobiota bacterium]|tara:strand:+ start:3344 stop:4276 length:933 start_codon:yes stop_codon:yes gene_type:complete
MSSHKLDESASGVYIISATPFTENGEVDIDSADRLVDFYIEKGVSGITILGMMGEAQKMAPEESESFLDRVMKRVGSKVPVIVGVSNAGLDNLVHLSKVSMDKGAAGVMVAPLAGLRTEEKVYDYFCQVFSALGDDIPVCYQDYPFATGTEISVTLFNRLVADFDQLVMLKHEECPGLNKISKVRQASDKGLRRVSILCGNGGLYLPQELARGANGAMTGFAYPEMLVTMVKLFQTGEHDRAEDVFDAYLPLVKHEQQPGFGLALRKEVLYRRGVISTPKVRAPGPKLNSIDQEELTRLISRVEKNLEAL